MINLKYYLSLFFLFIVSLTTFYPFLIVSGYNNFIWAISSLLFLIFSFVCDPKLYKKPSLFLFVTAIFILYSILFPLAFGNITLTFRYFDLSTSFLFIVGFLLSYRRSDVRGPLVLLFMVLLFTVFTYYFTFTGISNQAFAARLAMGGAGAGGDGSDYLNEGIGGYKYVYGLIFPALISFYLITYKTSELKIQYGLFFLFFFLASLYLITISLFATALIALMICSALLLFFRFVSYRITLVFLVILFPVAFYILEFVNFIIDIYANLFPDSTSVEKLNEIVSFIESSVGGEAINSRFDKYFISFYAYMNNLIFGISPYELNYEGGYITSFGQHSQLFDTFALFGSVIGVLHIYIYVQFPFFVCKILDFKSVEFTTVFVFAALIILTLNNFPPSIGFGYFYVVPVLLYWLRRKSARPVGFIK